MANTRGRQLSTKGINNFLRENGVRVFSLEYNPLQDGHILRFTIRNNPIAIGIKDGITKSNLKAEIDRQILESIEQKRDYHLRCADNFEKMYLNFTPTFPD